MMSSLLEDVVFGMKLQNVDSLPMLINLRHEFFLSHDFSWTLSQCRGLGLDELKFISYHAPLRCYRRAVINMIIVINLFY